jgi:hypothetical protein
MLGTILIVILVLALFGALPRWSHSRDWGYYPTGGLGLVLFDRCRSFGSRPDLNHEPPANIKQAPQPEGGACFLSARRHFFSSF